MRISDRLALAAKGLQGRWAVLPAAGMAIAAFCLCFAGAVLVSVQLEKAEPYELSVTAEALDDSDIQGVGALEDVMAATALLDVPAVVTANEYAAPFTLTGIQASCFREEFALGTEFPDSGVMPYIVLNKAALKTFEKEMGADVLYGGDRESEASDGIPEVDWLNANVTVQMGEGKPVVARICGVLDGDADAQESAAYISLSAAKALLQGQGQIPVYTAARVRITNIGAAEAVSRELARLGYAVSNSNAELQAKWDGEMKEMAYLIVVGAFGLLCSAVLLAAWRRISSLQDAGAYAALVWMGLRRGDIRALFTLQSLMISVTGAAIGILVSLMLPSFLTAGETVETIFLLTVPVGVVLLSAGICVLFGAAMGLIQQVKKQS